jgi:phosphoribosyl-AMP cyclohydrolase
MRKKTRFNASTPSFGKWLNKLAITGAIPSKIEGTRSSPERSRGMLNVNGERKQTINLKGLKFDKSSLIPAIIQDYKTSEVLMLAFMNKESLRRTIKSGRTCFWSRSRKKYWVKGETSGNYQFVKTVAYDCDSDALLIKVRQVGVACHTGNRSCFYRRINLRLPRAKQAEECFG